MRKKSFCEKCGLETEHVFYANTTAQNNVYNYKRCKNVINNKVCNYVRGIE